MNNSIRLLVIDGDLGGRKFIQKALKNSSLNVNVSFITALEESEEVFSENDWDLILSDYNDITNSGKEGLKQLLVESKVDVPVIVMSEGLTESIVKELVNYGISDLIIKSLITPESIGLSISKALIVFENQKTFEDNLTEAKLKAEKLVRLRQDFLANMSHEIRTPMNAIIGFTDIVLENELTFLVRDKVEKIKQSGENLLVIINDILDLTKIETGKLGVEKINFSLEKVLDNVMNQLETIANDKKVRLVFNKDLDVPENLNGDPVRLYQILTNLLDNAIKFTEKGFVELRVKIPDCRGGNSKIQFEIEDTGIGIPLSKQERIFDSFAQASVTTTRKFGGTGLGLSICKKLVHLLGGEIWLNSEKNVGSTFFFTISSASVLGILETEKSKIEDFNIEDTLVLLVEDNMMNRELTSHFLKEWGVKYDVAENGELGLHKVNEKNYDIILMDLSMPKMNGYEATKKIRSFKNAKACVPILAMTANAFKDDIDKCFEVGMNDHISKPFKSRELKSKIFHLVDRTKKLKAPPESMLNASNQKKEEPLFSLDLLKEMGGDNQVFIEEMVKIYSTQSPITLEKLSEAVESWEIEGIKNAAHKLRSPSALMGISEAVELAEFIEMHASNEEKLEAVKGAAEKLNMLINKVVLEIKLLYS
jgi:signal transduction histidine kinase/HPt (histidine-containing phosphotransfer) domain-containing protein